MTNTEIVLFKELIRETVKSVLKEEKLKIGEEMKKTFAQDLKEIKLLIAKQIKENREKPVQIVERKVQAGEAGTDLSETRQKALRNILGNMGMPKAPTPSQNLRSIKESKLDPTTKSILMQTAMSMTDEDKEALGEVIPTESYEENYFQEEVEDAYVPKNVSNLPDFYNS